MKIALLIFSCVLSYFSRAAPAEWNTTFVMYEGSDLTGEHDDVYCLVNPYLLLYADISGSSLVLTALADSNLVNANTFVLAAVGDVVSREYIDSFNRYFAYAEKGNWDSSHSDYQIGRGQSPNRMGTVPVKVFEIMVRTKSLNTRPRRADEKAKTELPASGMLI